MHRHKQPMEIEHTETGMIEIRYFDDPKRSSYLCWKIPINEAESLAKWWAIEGSQDQEKTTSSQREEVRQYSNLNVYLFRISECKRTRKIRKTEHAWVFAAQNGCEKIKCMAAG